MILRFRSIARITTQFLFLLASEVGNLGGRRALIKRGEGSGFIETAISNFILQL